MIRWGRREARFTPPPSLYVRSSPAGEQTAQIWEFILPIQPGGFPCRLSSPLAPLLLTVRPISLHPLQLLGETHPRCCRAGLFDRRDVRNEMSGCREHQPAVPPGQVVDRDIVPPGCLTAQFLASRQQAPSTRSMRMAEIHHVSLPVSHGQFHPRNNTTILQLACSLVKTNLVRRNYAAHAPRCPALLSCSKKPSAPSQVAILA